MHLENRNLKSEARNKEVNFVLKLILALNIFVLLIKAYIGFEAQSLSIMGDAVHSGIDSLNNIVALVMFKIASEPPDPKHPYGHGKFETLGALAVVAFLAIASFELIEKSVMRLLNPGDFPNISELTVYLLAATLVVNIFVWAYEKHQAKKLDSEILMADAEHTFSDILITISILASTFFIAKGFLILDPIISLLVAGVIIRSGVIIVGQTVPILVDEAWIEKDKISTLILSVEKVVAFTNFKSRRGHLHKFLEMDVSFDTDSLTEAHELSHKIEEKIQEHYGSDVQVKIHIEPK